MPSIHELFKCFEGFTYCIALYLNMGFWTILLESQTFTTPVHNQVTLGKVLLPPSSNGTCLFTRHIPREISELFINMIFIIVYQDNILVLTSSSFDDDLQQLQYVFKWLHHNKQPSSEC
jgi:hypothetical protein